MRSTLAGGGAVLYVDAVLAHPAVAIIVYAIYILLTAVISEEDERDRDMLLQWGLELQRLERETAELTEQGRRLRLETEYQRSLTLLVRSEVRWRLGRVNAAMRQGVNLDSDSKRMLEGIQQRYAPGTDSDDSVSSASPTARGSPAPPPPPPSPAPAGPC
eukprot:TRINITY_DN21345_c0_g1_i1.p1 TRINITY_DN21345_c0_g1~~TRINITY_DN21345_c0_g1_i1.p1  ORF type:complete len:160 (+),score=43.19 TRINITY_DN21345_c0_g1_i1:86-565(+)